MEQADKPQAIPQLDANRFKLAEHEFNRWCITVEQGITRAQILNPAFYSQFSSKMRPYDTIAVRCDDGTLYAELLVIQSERTWARVHVLSWHDLTSKDVAQSKVEPTSSPKVALDPSKEFKVKYMGAHKKWSVIRQSDEAIVREGEDNKANAELWLVEYQRVTA